MLGINLRCKSTGQHYLRLSIGLIASATSSGPPCRLGTHSVDNYGMASAQGRHKGSIPQDSFRPTLLELWYHGEGADAEQATYATGTAFFLKIDGDDFLITARHNLTGWDKINDKPLSTTNSSLFF